MENYTKLRHLMVETQLRPSNIADSAILEAFRAIPREVFIADAAKKPLAYVDTHIHIGNGRYLLSPLLVAQMLQAAEIRHGSAVLIIGGSGYMAALAGYMGATVFVLESDREFALRTSEVLTHIKEDSVIFVEGDMTKGWINEAPYDLILFGGGISRLEGNLTNQMDNGGRIIALVNQADGKGGMVKLWEKWHHHITSRILFEVSGPFLPGFTPVPEFSF